MKPNNLTDLADLADQEGLAEPHADALATRRWQWALGIVFCLIAWALVTVFVILAGDYSYGQYTNVGFGARSIAPTVTNYVSQYWVTNGFGGGNFNYSAALSTNGMLVWTNICGAPSAETNFYLEYNDQVWRGNTYSGVSLAHVWDEGTNFPDTSPVPANYYNTTNSQTSGLWWVDTSSKPWNAATLIVIAMNWNTYQGWGVTNGPGAMTNINYEN